MGATLNQPSHSLPLPSSKTNALNVSQKMIEMFVRTKHKIDKSHEFALVVVNDDTAWVRLGHPGVPWGQGQGCVSGGPLGTASTLLRPVLPHSCLA